MGHVLDLSRSTNMKKMGLGALCKVLLGHVLDLSRITKLEEKWDSEPCVRFLLGHVAPSQTVWGSPGTCSTRLDSIKITPQKNQTKKMSKK